MQKTGDLLDFQHIDGMYSLCYDKEQNPVHIAAWTEVEIITKTKKMKCKHISITKINHWWFNWKCRGCNKRFKWLSTLDYLMWEPNQNKEDE